MNEWEKKTLYGPPKVGGDTLCYCTKCKQDMAHVISSMVDTKPAKVICKTCKSQHKYKAAPGSLVRSTTSRTPKVTVPKTVVKIAELWEKKIAECNESQMKDYSPKNLYQKGDVLKHSKFGMGVIEELRTPGKIVVLFRDAERTLVHGLEGSVSAS